MKKASHAFWPFGPRAALASALGLLLVAFSSIRDDPGRRGKAARIDVGPVTATTCKLAQ